MKPTDETEGDSARACGTSLDGGRRLVVVHFEFGLPLHANATAEQVIARTRYEEMKSCRHGG